MRMRKIKHYFQDPLTSIACGYPLFVISLTLLTIVDQKHSIISKIMIALLLCGLSLFTYGSRSIIEKYLKKMRLFWAVTLCIAMTVLAYTLLSMLWGDQGWLSGWTLKDDHSSPLERIKASLTILGGIGGVGYLVIKYREQRLAEKQQEDKEIERTNSEQVERNRKLEAEKAEANKKLVDAVHQLGDQSPQVRIAGVYAIADVANIYGSEKYGVDYNKRAVEILCGYLRTPRKEDSPVESTILTIMAQHLRNGTHRQKSTWSKFKLDLHGAQFIETVDLSETEIHSADFSECVFNKGALFRNTKFVEHASFLKAHSNQNDSAVSTNFQGAKFLKNADFSYSDLRGKHDGHTINFEGTEFGTKPEHSVTFYNSKLGRTLFKHSSFFTVDFRNSNLEGSLFQSVIFKGSVKFSDMLNREVVLRDTEFTADPSPAIPMKLADADFSYANIDNTSFSAVILKRTNFDNSELSGVRFARVSAASAVDVDDHHTVEFTDASFVNTEIINTRFSGITLERSNFKNAKFFNVRFTSIEPAKDSDKINKKLELMKISGTDFSESHFKGSEFQAVFSGDTKFEKSKFEGIDFKESEFIDKVNFQSAQFKIKANFECAKFPQTADFKDSIFDSGSPNRSSKCEVLFPKDFPLTSGLPVGSQWGEVTFSYRASDEFQEAIRQSKLLEDLVNNLSPKCRAAWERHVEESSPIGIYPKKQHADKGTGPEERPENNPTPAENSSTDSSPSKPRTKSRLTLPKLTLSDIDGNEIEDRTEDADKS